MVDEQSDRAVLRGDVVSPDVLVVIAVLAGCAAALSGASPTGWTPVDVAETLLAVGAVTWFGARAPWWAQVGAAAVAGALALAPVPLVLAVVAFAIAAWVSPLEPHLAPRVMGGAVAVGCTTNSLIRSEFESFTGASAIVGIGIGVGLIGLGWRQSPLPIRRLVVCGALAGLAVVVVLGVALGVAGLSHREEMAAARDQARDALTNARDLETAEAGAKLRESAASMRSLESAVGAWWSTPARLVPVMAQHRAVVTELGGQLARELERTADDLEAIEVDDLKLVNGRVDLAAVHAASSSADRVADRMGLLADAVDEVGSVWLHPTVSDRLDELAGELEDFGPTAQTASDVARILPGLLGEDSPRRYLLLFTSPSEARGVGGFIGNYAVLTADDGRLSVVEKGRRSDLESLADQVDAVLTQPADMMAAYGKFGLVQSDGTVSARVWSNLTMEPHFPSFAQAAVSLFEQGGNEAVDGVMILDPYVLEQLVSFVGPIDRPGGGEPLTGENTARYLLIDQYEGDESTISRIDALSQISEAVIGRILTSGLPALDGVARELKPLVEEQRLLFWSVDEDHQRVLADTPVAAGLPDPSAADGFSLALSNAAGNKVDAYLVRETDVRRVERDGAFTVQAEVTLTNTAPASGLSDYAIGNLVGLEKGSSRLYLSAYTTSVVTSATADGVEVPVERGADAGWVTASHYVVLPPGGSLTMVYEFPARTAGEIVGRLQPLANR